MLDTLTRPGSAGQVSAPIVEVPTISGRFLAHAKLTPSQRAGIAASIQLGELRSERLTEGQVTEACRANRVYVRKARRATPAATPPARPRHYLHSAGLGPSDTRFEKAERWWMGRAQRCRPRGRRPRRRCRARLGCHRQNHRLTRHRRRRARVNAGRRRHLQSRRN